MILFYELTPIARSASLRGEQAGGGQSAPSRTPAAVAAGAVAKVGTCAACPPLSSRAAPTVYFNDISAALSSNFNDIVAATVVAAAFPHPLSPLITMTLSPPPPPPPSPPPSHRDITVVLPLVMDATGCESINKACNEDLIPSSYNCDESCGRSHITQ